jgi:lysophospholipase L1-like esterase
MLRKLSRLFPALALLFALGTYPPVFASTTISDNFTASAGTRLEDSTPSDGGSWRWYPFAVSQCLVDGSGGVYSPNLPTDLGHVYYAGNIAASDRTQSSSIVIKAGSTNNISQSGPGVDFDPATNSGYYLAFNLTSATNQTIQLLQIVNGTQTQIATATVSPNLAVNDTITLTIAVTPGTPDSITWTWQVNSGTVNSTTSSATLSTQPQPLGVPFFICNNSSSTTSRWKSFSATYDAASVPTETTPILRLGWIGDSNGALRYAAANSVRQLTAEQYAAQTVQSEKNWGAVEIWPRSGSNLTSTNYAGANSTYGTTLTSSAVNWFTKRGVSLVCIQLGTNDSRTATATTQSAYQTNITTIASALKAAGIKVVFCYPPYVVSTTSGFNATSLTLLQQYASAMDTVAATDSTNYASYSSTNTSTTTLAQSNLYSWFSANQSELSGGIHYALTSQGTQDAARIIANAYELLSGIGGTPTVTPTGQVGVQLTGTLTSWTGSPFTCTAPATILAQTVTDTTHAYLVIKPNGASSTTVTDNVGNSTVVSLVTGSALLSRGIHSGGKL